MTESNIRLPEHKIENREDDIVITIVAPLSKPKKAALVLEKNKFTFDSPPYLMKIKLPHAVHDRFHQQAYDNATGTYKIKLKKSNAKIETDSSGEEENEEFLELQNHLKSDNVVSIKKNEVAEQFYGFANKYSNMFGKLYEEFSEIIDLPHPDTTDVKDRRKLRLENEKEKWSEDHYLADMMETDHLESIYKYKPPWDSSPVLEELNQDEKEVLCELSKKSKNENLDEELKKMSEFQLVDILFGYAYNKRTTEGDNTVESGWTINKLSATLSWFEVFEDLKSVVLTCYKRALIYPLYRNWKLNQIVHKDVVNILKLGSKQVTRSLIEVKEMFNEIDNQYVLNTLYIDDLCWTAYHMSDERFKEISEELEKVVIKKYEVDLEIPLMEIAAHLALEEDSGAKPEADVKKIVDQIAQLNLSRASSSSDGSTESDSDESDSTQSSDKEN